MTTSEMERLLKKHGCKFVGHDKKHAIWQNPKTGEEVSIWRHKKEIPTGTAEKILKKMGIK